MTASIKHRQGSGATELFGTLFATHIVKKVISLSRGLSILFSWLENGTSKVKLFCGDVKR